MAEPAMAVIPPGFRGRWDATIVACERGTSDMALEVYADRLEFHESVARVRAVRPTGSDVVLVDMAVQGEGEVRQESRTLRLRGENRLDISVAGTTASRVRCGAPAALSGWDHQASGEGDGLSLTRGGKPLVTLFCPAKGKSLLVNVPSFRPVASEERMSFGSGVLVTILVADFTGDRLRGGVSGSGPVPSELAGILAAPTGIAVNYGSQTVGPFDRVPSPLVAAFLSGCRD